MRTQMKKIALSLVVPICAFAAAGVEGGAAFGSKPPLLARQQARAVVQSQREQARDLIREHNYKAALAAAQAAAQAAPNDYEPLYLASYAAFRLDRREEAERYVQAAKKLAPADSQPLLQGMRNYIAYRRQHPRAPFPRHHARAGVPDAAAMMRSGVTSVIIDARAFPECWRSMSPKIRRKDGSEVWGTKEVDPDYVLDEGIVLYAHSMEDARKLARSGRFPLILEAKGIHAGPFPSDPLLDDGDAKRLLNANAKSGCLDANNVIFIINK